MGNQINLTVNTNEKKQDLGDLFGIFFEDLNHAADGGLYAEMIRNRAFEFDEIDNKNYTHLTAWNISGLDSAKKDEEIQETVEKIYGTYAIEQENPLSENNPHYLTIDITEGSPEDISKNVSIVNEGFNTGLFLEAGKEYKFSVYCNSYGKDMNVKVSLTDEDNVLAESVTAVSGDGWNNYKCVFVPNKTTYSGRLKIQLLDKGKISLDHISLFPKDTFLQKENGLRADIATMLKDLKPKFMRFPGGCLVHDGSLNAKDRDSMYRWKNTIGDVTERPSKKDNWVYNQTLGLGYYEYFCFCEEINAKPLPVLPGAFNPHRNIWAPLTEMGEWIQETLDLIDFAKGDETTEWGKIRAELGHPAPFNLEYIAIGNEEIGDAFFERYPYFHNAIREKDPTIKIIGTSGPFPAGGEFEIGWESAIEHKADLVDEHYYMVPEWYLANMNRYAGYNLKDDDPKVFLGEYASWGNKYYNAIVEAAYMVKMQENARNIALACYAPLLCNADYVNWKPDMIWFNNHQVYGTANYYVQKLFMNHQGDYLLETKADGLNKPTVVHPVDFSGDIALRVKECTATYSDIEVTNDDTKEVFRFGNKTLTKDDNDYKLMQMNGNNYTVKFKAKQDEGVKGFIIDFGRKSEETKCFWALGGWNNRDLDIHRIIDGKLICFTREEYTIDVDHTYELKLEVKDTGDIKVYVDGQFVRGIRSNPVEIEDIYVTSSLEEATGDVIIKAVNIDKAEKSAKITLAGLEDKNYTIIVEDIKDVSLDSENSFEEPAKVCSKQSEITVASNTFEYVFPKESVTVLRIKK